MPGKFKLESRMVISRDISGREADVKKSPQTLGGGESTDSVYSTPFKAYDLLEVPFLL